jgi:cytoskeletal protein CcmA (bactofilin family)
MPSLYKTLAALLGLIGLFVLAPAGMARAAETASSDLVIIRQGDTSNGDLYAAGVKVIIEGVVDGDLTAFAADEVVISGEVTGSVLAVAPRVVVAGRIGGSLRTTGNVVEVPGTIEKDLVAGSRAVTLAEGSRVGGDVLVWGWSLDASGSIGEDLGGTQRILTIQGEVGGNVDVTVNRMSITGTLAVGGDLGYRSRREAEGLDQAEVGGAVVHKTPLPANIRVRALSLLTRILIVLGLLGASLLVVWGWPDRAQHAATKTRQSPWRSLGYGLLVMLSPLLLVGLAALIVGLSPASASFPLLAIFVPLILACTGIVLALSLFAGVPAALALGHRIRGSASIYGAVVIGSVIFGIVWLLPWIGLAVPLLVLPIGMGGWLLSQRPAETG